MYHVTDSMHRNIISITIEGSLSIICHQGTTVIIIVIINKCIQQFYLYDKELLESSHHIIKYRESTHPLIQTLTCVSKVNSAYIPTYTYQYILSYFMYMHITLLHWTIMASKYPSKMTHKSSDAIKLSSVFSTMKGIKTASCLATKC